MVASLRIKVLFFYDTLRYVFDTLPVPQNSRSIRRFSNNLMGGNPFESLHSGSSFSCLTPAQSVYDWKGANTSSNEFGKRHEFPMVVGPIRSAAAATNESLEPPILPCTDACSHFSLSRVLSDRLFGKSASLAWYLDLGRFGYSNVILDGLQHLGAPSKIHDLVMQSSDEMSSLDPRAQRVLGELKQEYARARLRDQSCGGESPSLVHRLIADSGTIRTQPHRFGFFFHQNFWYDQTRDVPRIPEIMIAYQDAYIVSMNGRVPKSIRQSGSRTHHQTEVSSSQPRTSTCCPIPGIVHILLVSQGSPFASCESFYRRVLDKIAGALGPLLGLGHNTVRPLCTGALADGRTQSVQCASEQVTEHKIYF